jgi:predicted nucleic acid-binding protein
MPSAIFLDTNILIYAAAGARDEPRKWRIAHELLLEPNAGLSGQVLAEFYVNATKPGRLSPAEAATWVDKLSVLRFAEIDADIVMQGIAVSQRYRVSYWDAALIAAAERLGADILYTEDLSHGQTYRSVRAVNPFHQN